MEEQKADGQIDFFAEPIAQGEDSLTRLRDLADEQTILENEVGELELQLAKKKQELAKVAEEKIPELMTELNMAKFTLADGFEISIKEKLNASIKEHNKPEAYKWIKENGYGGIIKTDLSVAFGKGELEKAVELADKLTKEGFAATASESIHASTLSSFVRERLAEAGDEGSLDEEATVKKDDEPVAVESDGFDDGEAVEQVKKSAFPKDLFGVFIYKRAEIKEPKKKKK